MAKRKILVERSRVGAEWYVSMETMTDAQMKAKNDSLGWIKYKRMTVG